jgi:hypothetical protein
MLTEPVFLEYAMSCEGCKDHLRTEERRSSSASAWGGLAAKFLGSLRVAASGQPG